MSDLHEPVFFQTYDANFEKTMAMFTEIKPHITTTFLRIVPTSTAPTLRMELFGKPVSKYGFESFLFTIYNKKNFIIGLDNTYLS